MKKALLGSAAAIVLATMMANTAVANSGVQTKSVEDRIEQINDKYQAEFDRIEADGSALSQNAPKPTAFEGAAGVNFDVEWDVTTIKIDVPEIKLKRRDMKLHLPQFRMKRTSIKWDNPEFHWAVTKVGEYPCFKGLKMYSCDIKTKVPQVRMVRKEAKFDVPEVFWDTTTIKMDIPEFFTNRIEIKMHLPQFYAQDVDAQIEAHKSAADGLANRADELATRQKAEIEAVVREDLNAKRVETVEQFDVAITQFAVMIEKIRKTGADPSSVEVDGQMMNYVAILADLRQKKADVLVQFDNALKAASA